MANQILFGDFVPTTQSYDISLIYQTSPNSPNFKEFIVELYNNYTQLALPLNRKETGLYPLQEFVTGEQLFARSSAGLELESRGVFKRTFFISSIGSGATVTTALDSTVTAQYQFITAYGMSTDASAGSHKPIPYIAGGGAYVRLECNNTQIIVENQSGAVLNNVVLVIKFTKD